MKMNSIHFLFAERNAYPKITKKKKRNEKKKKLSSSNHFFLVS